MSIAIAFFFLFFFVKAAVSRRDCCIVDFLVFWPLQSFRVFPLGLPRAIDAGAMIQMYPLGLGSVQYVVSEV